MNGAAHAKASVALAVPCSLAAAAYTSGDYAAMIGAGLGCLAGISIGPDLDQEAISRQEWKIIRRTLGLGFLFLLFWWPYATLHKHRGFSHTPVLGTLGRILYIVLMVGVPCLLLLLFGVKLEFPSLPVSVWRGLVWSVFGLIVSDFAHWAMDFIR